MMTSKFLCSECEKAFNRRDHWVNHMKTHDDDYVRNHLTCACDRTFSSVTALTRHRRKICPLSVTKTYKVIVEPITKDVETQTDFEYCKNCMSNQIHNTSEEHYLE